MQIKTLWILFAVFSIFMGLHNIDNTQNLLRYNLLVEQSGIPNLILGEVTLFGFEVGADFGYVSGLFMVIIGSSTLLLFHLGDIQWQRL